jgi:hypothetical protein
MQVLRTDQLQTIEFALAGMRATYNAFQVEPCEFTGIPEDLSALDYIPYELPIAPEYAAGSLAFSLAWGHVLVNSFGFSWVASDDCARPKEFAVQHDSPSVLIFPYFRLLEITQSSGPRESPAETLWFETIRFMETRAYIADGWHPVVDAAHCPERLGCPASTTKACQRLIDTVPEFYGKMSTYPYAWARGKRWIELTEYAEQLVTNHQLANR